MKPGAKRMAKGEDKPYMQVWTGLDWICFVHKPQYDEETGDIRCANCHRYICNVDGKRKV